MENKKICKMDDSNRSVVNNTLVMGIVGLLPLGIGSFWNACENALAMKKIHERLNLFCEKLEEMGMSVSHLNKEFLESDEGYDLLLTSIKHAIQNRSEYKIERIAQILSGVIKEKNISISNAEIFLNIIGQTTEEEIILLAKLYKQGIIDNINPVGTTGYYAKIVQEMNIPYERWHYLVKRLEGLGMIRVTGTIAASGDVIYCFTGMGDELCKYLIGKN